MDWSEAKVKLMKFGFSAEEIGILRVKFTENPEALSIFDDEDEIVESAMKEMLGKSNFLFFIIFFYNFFFQKKKFFFSIMHN